MKHITGKALRRALHKTIKAIAGFVVGLCIAAPLLLSLEPVQRWLGSVASGVIYETLGIKTHIGRLRIQSGPRIVLTDFQIFDQRDSLALDADYLSAKLEVLPILKKQFRINSIQLVDADIHLYQSCADSAMNIQFIIDALRRVDPRKPPPLDVQANAVVLRDCRIRYDRLDQPKCEGAFDKYHIDVRDFNTSFQLRALTKREVDFHLQDLSFREVSGLQITDGRFHIEANTQTFNLRDFYLLFAQSELRIDRLAATYPQWPWNGGDMRQWVNQLHSQGNVSTKLCPSDFSAFASALQSFGDPIAIDFQLNASDGKLAAEDLLLDTPNHEITLNGSIMGNFADDDTALTCQLTKLHTSPRLSAFLTQNLGRKLPPFIEHLGQTTTIGTGKLCHSIWNAYLNTTTEVGSVALQAIFREGVTLSTELNVTDARPALLFQSPSLPDHVSMKAVAEMNLPAQGHLPEGEAHVQVQDMTLANKHIQDLLVDLTNHDQQPSLHCQLHHPNADFSVYARLKHENAHTLVEADADVRHFEPSAFGLMQRMADDQVRFMAKGEIDYKDAEHVKGYVSVDSLTLNSDSLGNYHIGHVSLYSTYDNAGRKHIAISSHPLEAQVNGIFRWNQFGSAIQQIAHHYMPKILPAPHEQVAPSIMTFHVDALDTIFLHHVAGIPLKLPQRCQASGRFNTHEGTLQATAYLPLISYGTNTLTDVGLNIETRDETLHTAIGGQWLQSASTVKFKTSLQTNDQLTRAQIAWENDGLPYHRGAVAVEGMPYIGQDGEPAFRVKVDSSQVVISDTLWHIHPAVIDYHEGRLFVDGLGATAGNRLLAISGTASSNPSDSLTITLERVNLGYLSSMMRGKKVRFGGDVSGRAYATTLMSEPRADAYLNVDALSLNDAPIGMADLYAGYGYSPRTIVLTGRITEEGRNNETRLDGSFKLGKDDDAGLNLHIDADHLNIAFLGTFLKKIMQDLQGHTSGHARLFGPLKTIDLEGDLLLHEAHFGVKSLGATFALINDSVHLRPGLIHFPRTMVYDPLGTPPAQEHSATLEGYLKHTHFGRINYDFHINANNLLAYNRPNLGNDSFFGVAYVSGDAHMMGNYGRLQADMNLTPMSGTIVTYNAAQPDKLTEARFIRYKPHETQTQETKTSTDSISQSTEIQLNFDFNVTPEATLKVLMDMRSGDNITLQGNGHLTASYFNKGSFQLYGTYHVEQGMYDMSIQDFLHKEFKFTDPSHIVFGGRASEANLNLRAAYTVPNVSLDDLSTTSLGLSNTRVDCIMHITGHPETPAVTFDFDLPTASEEEKSMVKAMLSTEEERSMQVVYLLGIGRFFSFNGPSSSTTTSQSEMAMNSLLSSTLSSQFNRALSNALSTTNWNFGTNLRTGQMGWNNVDVEGILSGRLLGNRLLVSGNFGYRERLYNTSNFIGDFDVQYLITPSGSLSLKAYNKSNDRYFIQSSLLTQGIALQLKKDFTRLRQIFQRSKREKKKKQK